MNVATILAVNESLNPSNAVYYLWASAALIVLAFLKFFQGDPLRWLGHITYLSGALGTGKTSFVALVASILRRKKLKFYSTFALEGATPFDLSEDAWPQEPNVYFFLDELLALESQDFLDFGMLTDGLAFARQNSQKVILLSQSHLPQWGKIAGTIGIYCVTKGISLGKFGRLNVMRWSGEPFKRTHGFRSPGAIRSFIYIPPSVFRSYNSRLIFGYTCNRDLSPIAREEFEPRRIRRAARRLLRKKRADLMAKAEAARIQSEEALTFANAAHESTPALVAGGGAAHVEPPVRKPRVHRVKRAV